jgi:hypothetical protein
MAVAMNVCCSDCSPPTYVRLLLLLLLMVL